MEEGMTRAQPMAARTALRADDPADASKAMT
jgi:hypothetical protein